MNLPKLHSAWVNREAGWDHSNPRYSVGARDEKGRSYHAWIYGPKRITHDGCLYFNPPRDQNGKRLDAGSKGYFATRTIDTDDTRGAAILKAMIELADAGQLFQEADAKAEKSAKEAAEHNAAVYAKRLKEEAGPALYDALLKAAAILELGTAANMVDIIDTLAIAREALRKAVTRPKSDTDLV